MWNCDEVLIVDGIAFYFILDTKSPYHRNRSSTILTIQPIKNRNRGLCRCCIPKARKNGNILDMSKY